MALDTSPQAPLHLERGCQLVNRGEVIGGARNALPGKKQIYMKMKLYHLRIIISILLTHAVFITCKGQEESADAKTNNDTSTTDYSGKIRDFDFYKLWGTDTIYFEDESKSLRQELIGFVGDDYQRLYIHFLSFKKNTSKINEYRLAGKTKVKSNIYSFKGTLVVNSIRIYKNNPNPALANVKEGFINSSLILYEDSNQTSSGKINRKTYHLYYFR